MRSALLQHSVDLLLQLVESIFEDTVDFLSAHGALAVLNRTVECCVQLGLADLVELAAEFTAHAQHFATQVVNNCLDFRCRATGMSAGILDALKKLHGLIIWC